MRAFDLMVFMICLNLSIGLVNEVLTTGGQKTYYQQNEGDGWTHQLANASEISNTSGASPVSGTLEMAKWALGGMLFFASLMSSVLWIEPVLEHTFMIPQAWSLILQTLIWIIYVATFIQWWTNRPFKAFD